ncbi:BRO-N domain-containing protein [Streptomyces xanthophaeus]
MTMVAPSAPERGQGLQPFNISGAEIRFGVTEDGKAYAVAADFARTMGYRDASNALRILDEDEQGTQPVSTPGGRQQMKVIFEDGMWELIFRSSLPGAKEIKKRVKEILSQIRKTGSFTVKPLDELELAERQVELIREKRAALARAVKAEAFQSAIEAGDGLTLRAFHKKYFSEVGERAFMDHLYARGYLIDQRGKGADREDGTVRDGAQHRHPSAKGKPFFYLHGHGRYGGKRREATRVRPGTPELDLKAALIRDGLVANNNDTGRPLEVEAA